MVWNKLFDLLGMSEDYDDEDIVITDHSRQDEVAAEIKSSKDPVEPPPSEAAPAPSLSSDEERKERIMRPLPPKAEVVLCRGAVAVELLDDMLTALRQGRLVLVDLGGVEVDEANSVLESLHQTVVASRGALFRVSKTTFLATPVKTACEEWIVEDDTSEGEGD
ncbi:FtsZ-interacting cell division protein YlmF [Dethiosulfovibrio salsuginis]|uniref:FtsZ-interacting cell division protein YlmF n=1 Tax=Dethiosulfovibrio salsuginis TaxID=561720 RepID=A0A1X7J2W0_9BACT|nr:FtsZ-interacting cell division protein YlmF [Dethiosulfovibrio salsuginis]